MEGRNVTNYSLDKPSYSYSTQTTEFDDALIQRGIINHQQAMIAKGASVEEAERLTELKETGGNSLKSNPQIQNQSASTDNAADSDEEFSEDDPFLEEYRQKRMEEMKMSNVKDSSPTFGEAIPISRTEWMREVNEDSNRVWVIVCLTSSNTNRTGRVEEAVKFLATRHLKTKFVLIPSHSAIPNWPDDNLPSLFIYRHGRMQQELVQMQADISTPQLESILDGFGVFEGSGASE